MNRTNFFIFIGYFTRSYRKLRSPEPRRTQNYRGPNYSPEKCSCWLGRHVPRGERICRELWLKLIRKDQVQVQGQGSRLKGKTKKLLQPTRQGPQTLGPAVLLRQFLRKPRPILHLEAEVQNSNVQTLPRIWQMPTGTILPVRSWTNWAQTAKWRKYSLQFWSFTLATSKELW